MCIDCYKEAGSPRIINNLVIDASNLIKINLGIDPLGGYAHIVIDDWNLEDEHIEYCIEAANKRSHSWVSEESRQASLLALSSLKALSEGERYTAMAITEGFIEPTLSV
jgi:hypothetical protein